MLLISRLSWEPLKQPSKGSDPRRETEKAENKQGPVTEMSEGLKGGHGVETRARYVEATAPCRSSATIRKRQPSPGGDIQAW